MGMEGWWDRGRDRGIFLYKVVRMNVIKCEVYLLLGGVMIECCDV